jgi:hypothetical protein
MAERRLPRLQPRVMDTSSTETLAVRAVVLVASARAE